MKRWDGDGDTKNTKMIISSKLWKTWPSRQTQVCTANVDVMAYKQSLPFQVATFPREGPIFSDQRQGMISSSLAFPAQWFAFTARFSLKTPVSFRCLKLNGWSLDDWVWSHSLTSSVCSVTGMKGNLQRLVDLCSFELTIIHISSSWACI